MSKYENIYVFACGCISYGHAPDHHKKSSGCQLSVCLEPGDDYYFMVLDHLKKGMEIGTETFAP